MSKCVDNSETPTEVCKAASQEKLSVKEQKTGAGSSIQKRKDEIVIVKTEVEELEENQDSDMDRVIEDRPKVKAGRKRKKVKTKKMKKRQPEMKDLMVGRRMASLNASAMMQVVNLSALHISWDSRPALFTNWLLMPGALIWQDKKCVSFSYFYWLLI